MGNISISDAVAAWSDFESQYRMIKEKIDGFIAEAAIVGTQLIQDVPTRMETDLLL